MSDPIPSDGGTRPDDYDEREAARSHAMLEDFPEELLRKRLGRMDTRRALADLCRSIPGLEEVLLPKGIQADALTRKAGGGSQMIRGVAKKIKQDPAAWDAFRTAVREQIPPETFEALEGVSPEDVGELSGTHTTEGLLLAAATDEKLPEEGVLGALIGAWSEENLREEKRASEDARTKDLESELESLRMEGERLSFALRAATQNVEALSAEVETLNGEREGVLARARGAEGLAAAATEERDRLLARSSDLERHNTQLSRALDGERRAYSKAAERVDELHEELGKATAERDRIQDALQNARFTDRGFGELLIRSVKNEVNALPNSLEAASRTARLLEFMGKVLQVHDEVRNPRESSRPPAEDPEDPESSPPPPPEQEEPEWSNGAPEDPPAAPPRVGIGRRPTLSFRALGGAGEVGGSSHLLDFGRTRVLVDAGIKPDGRGIIAPAFDMVGPLDAAIITHAHLDHCGALPLLIKDRPDLPIYCTPPSAKLIVNALNDHSAMGGSAPGGVPIHEVKKRLIPVDFGKEFEVGDTKVTLTESGHLLGAASALVRSGSAMVFHTGDISMEDHFSIPSAKLPDVHDIDLLIMEATLADQQPQPFAESIKTMIRVINDTTLNRAGTVLIPTYALGQAQEIILGLKHFSDELDRDVFIYVDGSVVTTSERLYAEQIGYMKPYLQQSYPREVFFSENIRAVANDHRARERLLTSPCAIIASPVTMQGGMSGFYRERLQGSEKNAVILPSNAASSYGARRSEEEKWRVERVNFAAHCTQEDLLGITRQLSPRQIILIHGSKKRISSLATRLAPDHKIHTPTVGETVRTVL